MPDLSRDAVVQIWQSSKDAASVLQRGFKIVHAPADFFYLVLSSLLQSLYLSRCHGLKITVGRRPGWLDSYGIRLRLMERSI